MKFLIMLPFLCFLAELPRDDFAGLYDATGNDGDKDYSYVVQVTKAGKNYAVVWTDERGASFCGVGTKHKDNLIIAWTSGSQLGFHIMEKTETGCKGFWSLGELQARGVLKSVNIDSSEETWKALRRTVKDLKEVKH